MPPAAIQFSYSGDYKTVGDYCYTKSLTGVCTLTSKCPEVVRDIQKGKNPLVCSYQGSEAIVCCPKRNNQPNQSWSSNNNNINNPNNQGSATNQNPVNQINQIYPTQQPNQPNQGNQFFQHNQNFQTTQVHRTTQLPQQSQHNQNFQEVPNRHTDLRRSEQSKYLQ